MSYKMGVIMDPIESIKIIKDTTFAMLLEAERRGWEIYYMTQTDLFVNNNEPMGSVSLINVDDDPENYFNIITKKTIKLRDLDIVLMRKDPPFNMKYIYTTYILDLVEASGTLVVNPPQALRDINEKFAATFFPEISPDCMISASKAQLLEFYQHYKNIILKPLDGMGGVSVFHVKPNDPNINVIIETLTEDGAKPIIGQQYISEIKEGDKRMHIIDGEVIGYGLKRMAKKGETRANLAAGAEGVPFELTQSDKNLAQMVAKGLKDRGILFAGIDVIGEYLTEVNVTSPTCVREVDKFYNINICEQLFEAITRRLKH